MFLTRTRADSEGGTADRSPWGSFWFEPLGGRTSMGMAVTPTRALSLPAVFACVQVLAKSFAVMPFMLWQIDAAGRREKRPQHWLYRLIAKAPNRFQTPFEWRLMLQGHLALRGNAFCQIVANARGEIVELLPLHPDRMQVELLNNGDFRYAYTDQFGKRILFTRGEIWHLRWMSQDGFVGLSPIELAREVIGEGLEQQSYSTRFYANDTRPPGWIEFDGHFATKAAKKSWRESWEEAQGGANARKVAVLEKGMKYHQLTLSDADTHHVTARTRNLRDLARIWGIPPHKVGDLERSTNNNIEHQSIEFWTDTMLPWARMWSDAIDFFLVGPDSDEMLDAEFDIKPMMRGDGKARGERLRSLVLSGILRRNEAREEEGYDPVDGGDKLLVPLNMGTLGDDGEIEVPEGPDGEPPDGGDDPPDAPGNGAGGNDNRMRGLLRANAVRMARRISAGKAPSAAVLAEAMAVDEPAAARWLANRDGEQDEAGIVESLMALAGVAPAAVTPETQLAAEVRGLREAVASRPAPAIHVSMPAVSVSVPAPVITTTVEGSTIHVPEREVHNTVEVPAPQVHVSVAAPEVTVEAPKVNVEAPVVHNTVEVPEPKVTVMQAEPSKGGQADRPYPTQTIIRQRDAHGRADVIETRPLDE